jgi:hypothetical protein
MTHREKAYREKGCEHGSHGNEPRQAQRAMLLTPRLPADARKKSQDGAQPGECGRDPRQI